MSTTSRFLFFLTCFFVSTNIYSQTAQIHPGGVTGSEVWYMADEMDILGSMFTNYSAYPIQIDACDEYDDYGLAFLNFNPSLRSGGLCLQYRSHLERSLNRTTFIVTEPEDLQDTYPHIGTKYNRVVPDILGPTYEDSLSINTYIIETQQGFASQMVSGFSQHQNASVHFYSWNNYDIDKTTKSYGQLGETDFFIGKKISHPELDGGPDFSGLLPEYIAFERQLTENERNRVESYLALKYGITKWHTEHYQNSQNKIFWDKANNGHFYNNIFGIGRDDMSGLNQLQCESAHAKDFLVAAIYEIMSTNAELQYHHGIENGEFLVFGDTSSEAVSEEPDGKNLHRLERVWLAQVRGDGIKGTPIRFRLDLMRAFEAMPELIEHVLNEELTLWMLHDPYVNNTFVSDFDNGRIKYYQPFDIDYGPNGEIYALFGEDDIFFDRDNSFFDQFTFAIGPDCIAQFRPRYDCKEIAEGPMECYELDIILTGHCDGEVEFIALEGEEHLDVWFNDRQTEINGEPTYTVYICAPGIYTAIIHVRSGTFEFEYEAEIIEQFYVDLGPDVQYLTAQQPEIILDAGQALANPEEAIYQWFFNGVQIYHYGSTLVADQPGEYCVIVTSPDGVCEIQKCVKVYAELEVQIDCHPGGCNPSEYQIEITIINGVPPFTTVVTEPLGHTTTHIHQGDTVISGLAQGENQGEFIITITDSLGSVFVGSCFFYENSYSTGSLGSDLTLSSSFPQHTLDASTSFGGPQNYSYQWLRNGIMLPNTTPQLTVDTPGLYTAKIYFPDDECYGYASQTVHSVLEGTISQNNNNCDEFANTVFVEIDFGFPPYEISITGTTAGGGSYTLQQGGYMGDFMLGGIPYGSYYVIVGDYYGNQIPQPTPQTPNVVFNDPMEDVEIDLIGYLGGCPCVMVHTGPPPFDDQDIVWDYTGCSLGSHPCVPDPPNGLVVALLDAAENISSPQDYTYEWFKNGVSMNIFTSGVALIRTVPEQQGFNEFMVRVTHISYGCYVEDSFIAYGWSDIQEYNPAPPPPPTTYNTTIYPNPSGSDATFYYQISTTSQETFNGTVELYSMLGQLIFSNTIQGQTQYTLPYRLVASGAYIIRTTLDDGTVKVDRVIIK